MTKPSAPFVVAALLDAAATCAQLAKQISTKETATMTSNQTVLFGEQLRDDAVKQVDDHANDEWKRAALNAVREMCNRRTEFTTDAVWWLLDGSGYETHENRAMGAVMNRARKLGWITPSDSWNLSTRPECHRRPIRVWRVVR